MKISKPSALIILDGFGYRQEQQYNAIAQAKIPNFSYLWNTYPHTLLDASGNAVGLPDYMNGNSEVGHLTIGAGCIIEQPMKWWLDSIADGSFQSHPLLLKYLEQLKSSGGSLHIMGLLSDAGVHAHEKQLYSLIEIATKLSIKKIIVHAILDGRDVVPRSAYQYLQKLTRVIHTYANQQVVLGSIHGRFYAMDRDNNWDRIEKTYRVLTEKQDNCFAGWEKVLEHTYAQGNSDEFVEPTQINPEGIIKNGDGIIFYNIRSDRARQFTTSFIQPQYKEFKPFSVKPLKLAFFITPVLYAEDLLTITLFPRPVIRNTLKDILSHRGKTIFAIAETEKYAHVTYFFRGENEEPVAGETRVMIPSIKTETYKNYPEMRANEITDAVIESLSKEPRDFYLINYSNADMVGHSGDLNATIQAIESLDKQLGILYTEFVGKRDGTLYITADHGKAEDMFDENMNQPRTGHTNNKVPFLYIHNRLKNTHTSFYLTQLSDIASFIIEHMEE